MKIALLVEGRTEKAFVPYLREFLRPRLSAMPNIDVTPYDGRIPTGDKLKRTVSLLLSGTRAADHVIALTDVYTGSRPAEFVDAADAKQKMRQWAGPEHRFHPHVAQYDFEAWLIPYWPTIQRLAAHNKVRPFGNPEQVNHGNPPAHRLREIFEIGLKGKSYIKPVHANAILRENGLSLAVAECTELKALVNTILTVCDGVPVA